MRRRQMTLPESALEMARRLGPVAVRGRGKANTALLAEQEGFSVERLRQILQLLRLAPEILADLEDPKNNGPMPREAELRGLTYLDGPAKQVEEYRRMVDELREAWKRAKEMP